VIRRDAVSVLFLGGLAMSCGSLTVTGDTSRSVFVSALGDMDASLGAVVVESSISLYICGGETRFASLSQWFEGLLDENGEASWETHDVSLRVRQQGHLLQVFVRVAGAEMFEAELSRVTGSGNEGLYEASDDGGRAGVIVLPAASDADPVVMGAWRAQALRVAQVTPVRPLNRSVRAVRVLVHRGTAVRPLWVLPVVPRR
jgi:hypothetical protein